MGEGRMDEKQKEAVPDAALPVGVLAPLHTDPTEKSNWCELDHSSDSPNLKWKIVRRPNWTAVVRAVSGGVSTGNPE